MITSTCVKQPGNLCKSKTVRKWLNRRDERETNRQTKMWSGVKYPGILHKLVVIHHRTDAHSFTACPSIWNGKEMNGWLGFFVCCFLTKTEMESGYIFKCNGMLQIICMQYRLASSCTLHHPS